MINHARNLLVNLDGSAGFFDEPGEELIDPDYRAKALPQALRLVRTALFGGSPDRAMLNYRARQLLGALHNTELESFITELDSRVTYDFDDDPFTSHTLYRPVVTKLGNTTHDLVVLGTEQACDATGRMRKEWMILVSSTTFIQITTFYPRQLTSQNYSSSGGLSEPIALPGSSLSIRVRPGTSRRYHLKVYARPDCNLAELVARCERLGDDVLSALFMRASRGEPFTTFYRLWADEKQIPYRLGGLVLALIYHTDELA